MLEKHQSEIDATLLSLEGDTRDLGRYTRTSERTHDHAYHLRSHGPSSPPIDRSDTAFRFAEGLSVQLKQLCEKVHAIEGTIEDKAVCVQSRAIDHD